MKHLSLVSVALLCVACAAGPLPVVSDGSPAPSPAAVAPVSRQLEGLAFGLPSADDLRAVQAYGFTGELLLPIRPSVGGATSTASQLNNGNHELYSYFPNPYGDGWGVSSVHSARVRPPIKGEVSVYVETTIQPILQAWADDAALYTLYSRMPNLADQRAGITRSHDPNATKSEAAIIENVGWPLPYVSVEKREALFFYEAGVVLWVKWAQQRYTEQNVPVSEEEAIAAMVAALRDPNAVSEEARTGIDHFLGVPYAGVFGPPEVNRWDDFVPTYDVPDEVDWNGSFSTEFVNKPVWHVGSTWGGGGYVDALTGKVIRFTRLRVGHGTGGPPSPFVPPEP